MKKIIYRPTEDVVGQRIDKALSQHPEILSRTQAARLINLNCVFLHAKPVKASHKVSTTDLFEILIPTPETTHILPLDLKLDVVFEDDSVLVVNKPAGLVVHPAAGHSQDTLVNALVHYDKKLMRGFKENRIGLVHRIDKDTSGLLVVAKTDSALQNLAKQFKDKTIHRLYWCVVFGSLANKSGTVKSYLRRHPANRKKFASEKFSAEAAPKGKLAITHYRVLKTHPSGNVSLVQCQLETGRTHQIRVHLSELKHPIVADPIYCTSHRLNSVRSVNLKSALSAAPHLMLHAAELGFVHPVKNKQLHFNAPWPQELHSLLKEIGFLDVE